jgi:hypothetical protein
MNIISNESLIKRNARIAQIAMIAGLIILAGGMVVSFSPSYTRFFYLTLLSLVFGFILSQIGIYYTNHFGRHPRPDEQLNQALKGLDGKYTLYHYMTPVPHLLVGPAGVWVLLPRNQRGRITFAKGRWRHQGGSLYLRIFAQEGIGRPDIDMSAETDKINLFFAKNLPEGTAPAIQTALVFTNPNVKIEISEDVDPPAKTVTADKLKEALRKGAKSSPLSPQAIQQITALLPEESL